MSNGNMFISSPSLTKEKEEILIMYSGNIPKKYENKPVNTTVWIDNWGEGNLILKQDFMTTMLELKNLSPNSKACAVTTIGDINHYFYNFDPIFKTYSSGLQTYNGQTYSEEEWDWMRESYDFCINFPDALTKTEEFYIDESDIMVGDKTYYYYKYTINWNKIPKDAYAFIGYRFTGEGISQKILVNDISPEGI